MKYFYLAIYMFSFFGAFAQSEEVSWTASLIKISETEYELKITGEAMKDWVIYSQHMGDDGPRPTIFTVQYPEGATPIGEFIEPDNPIKKMDDMFGVVLTKYKGVATFTQRIKSSKKIEALQGDITFMTCDNSKCLPPRTVDFSAILQ